MSEASSTLASLYMLLMLAGVSAGAGPTATAEAADVLVDPTRPRGWQAPAARPEGQGESAAVPLKLQGTFRAAGRRSAVINGQRVAVGDRVSGAEVVEIGKDRVVLEVDGDTVELARKVPAIKVPVDIRKTADSRGVGPWQGLAE